MVSSSVVRQIMRCVKEDAQLQEVLGEAIRSQPEWWLNGDPRINGRVCSLFANGQSFSWLTFFTCRLAPCKEILTSVGEFVELKVSCQELFMKRSSEFNVQAGSGTLYFTSIRKEKGQPFTICASVSLFLHYVTYMFFQYASKSSAMTVPLLSLTLNQYNRVPRYLSRTPATLFDKNNIFRASSPFMTGSKHLNTIVVEEKQLCLGQYIPRQRRLWVRGSEDYTLAVMAVILLVQRSCRVKIMIG